MSNQIESHLNFLSHQTWDEVRATWQSGEDGPDFERDFRSQGYESWQTWRDELIIPLGLDRSDWSLFEIDEPTIAIPDLRGGPFIPWQEQYYGGEKSPTFAEIVRAPGSDVTTRDTFADISGERNVDLIGLELNGQIYIVDGMHRCVTIALAAMRDVELDISVQLSLAETHLSELPMLN